ncbi:gluconokinase [Hymenobacter volaticus]|uniref:Gluconokinase n=1 Tax=Hymenobacter volaticus TaxID=2932254 RepID=A0ABY4G109_9BACT|nr:gluconokinase [Hymenobacter volaticus]UOQ64570.1 gluconokinase [Hymenobacter volaticus]
MASNVFIVMGVSGSGKTTIGRLLAKQLGLPFHDADDFHSPANIAKMSNGIPLTDADRQGWLADLAAGIGEWEKAGGAVLACSALKETYRQTLQAGAQLPLRWAFLDGSRELLQSRLLGRKNHYMSASLLDSQLATLEKPTYALQLPLAGQQPQDIVNKIIDAYAPSSN